MADLRVLPQPEPLPDESIRTLAAVLLDWADRQLAEADDPEEQPPE